MFLFLKERKSRWHVESNRTTSRKAILPVRTQDHFTEAAIDLLCTKENMQHSDSVFNQCYREGQSASVLACTRVIHNERTVTCDAWSVITRNYHTLMVLQVAFSEKRFRQCRDAKNATSSRGISYLSIRDLRSSDNVTCIGVPEPTSEGQLTMNVTMRCC